MNVLEGTLTDGSAAFAVVDPTARQCVGVVAERRFTAFLSPFQDEASATAALQAAGAVKVAPFKKRKASQ